MDHEPPQRRRFLIIHNALAGRRRSGMLEGVLGRLASAGAMVTLERATSFEDDRRLVKQALSSGQFDAVVAAGGDSTIRGVASDLAGESLPLGIIPVGTANVLAEEIGLARNARAISECLLSGPVIPVFPGLAGHERFLLMAGAGYDVRVLMRLNLAAKRRLGKLAFGWPMLVELFRRPQMFDVAVDGRTHRCSWLIVSNVAHYAGSFVIAPEQQLTSTGFHALIVRAPTRVALAGAVLAGGLRLIHRHPLIDVIPCQSVEVPAGQSVPIQLDGEPVAHDMPATRALKIEREGKPLRLITPAGARVHQLARAAGIPTVS